MKKSLLSILAVWLVGMLYAQAYTVSPSCPDFTDINASYVEATYGKTGNPFASQGVVAGRHTIISAQGTDPQTANALSVLPPGESAVVKLGNEKVGADAEALTYHFIVDPNFPILFVKFAVVFQDPGHLTIEQPRFVMRIMDKSGNLIEECAEYDVSAGAGITGFQTAGSGYSPVRWRNWTNVGLDMSSYAGKEVQVQFTTYDCTLSGHYGYAYFTAKCISNKLELSTCSGNSFTVEAPDGFDSYLWENGDKTRSTTRTKTGNDMNLSCIITSATGCRFTLSAFVSSKVAPGTGGNISATVCQGQPYTKNYFNLPPQTEPGTFTYYNTFLNPNTCSGNVTTILTLKVEPVYHFIKAAICQGEDYTANGFNIQKPAVGVYRDTLHHKSTTISCDSIVCLELTISPSFNLPNKLTGNTNPCSNELAYYSFAGNAELNIWQWEVPDNAYIVSGKTGNTIQVYFTDDTPGNITLKGENGCGTGAVPLFVQPRQSYENLIVDSICTGEVYNRHNFNLGKQDSVGYFSFVHNEKTKLGCDSITTLALFVFPTPTVDIVTKNDSILCSAQIVTLHAIAGNASVNFAQPPPVAIGDIYCTDGSIVKPKDYASSGKTAEGIVFYVDNTGKHGWIVDLKRKTTGDKIQWSNTEADIPALGYYGGSFDDVMSDIDGYTKTGIMRKYIPNSLKYAPWVVDYDNGWYLPAAGQAIMLSNVYNFIRPSILITGNQSLGYGGSGYWVCSRYPNGWNTSTGPVFTSQGAPTCGFVTGTIGCVGKTSSASVIQIRNF